MTTQRQSVRLSLRAALALPLASGVLLALSFPRPGVWPLAWIGLAPWIVALRLGPALAAAAGSYLAGAAFFGILLWWLHLFGMSVWALAVGVLSFVFLAWGLLAQRLGRLGTSSRVLGVAVLWAALEWLRGLGRFGFSWGWLGYSQSPVLELMPVARALGTVGLSFLMVLANAALAEAAVSALGSPRPARDVLRGLAWLAAVAAALLGARVWVAGLQPPDGPVVRVAVVQGSAHGPLRPEQVNIPLTREEQARALRVYEELTLEAARDRPALVVWPESAIPGSPEQDPWIAERMAEIAQRAQAWLIAGGPRYDAEGRIYNSAYLYGPSGNLITHYDKVHLVPFGEYVPGRAWLPFLDRYHVREVCFTPGVVHPVIQAGTTLAVGPMICFESTFPTIAWGLARRGAQGLVVITNDAWFGHTAAAAQHRQIAVLRAAETGLWVFRGASTGISSVISPEGRVVSEAGLYSPAVLVEEVRLPGPDARPAGPGPAFAWALVAAGAAFVIAPSALPRPRRRGRAAPPPGSPRRRGRADPR